MTPDDFIHYAVTVTVALVILIRWTVGCIVHLVTEILDAVVQFRREMREMEMEDES